MSNWVSANSDYIILAVSIFLVAEPIQTMVLALLHHEKLTIGQIVFKAAIIVAVAIVNVLTFTGSRHSANEIAAANQKAEQAVAMSVQLAEAAAPRTMTHDHDVYIATALKPYPGVHVDLNSKTGDKEALLFAQFVGGALRGAGWVISSFSPNALEGGPEGTLPLVVWANPADETSASELVSALEKCGFSATVRKNDARPRGALAIYVGPK